MRVVLIRPGSDHVECSSPRSEERGRGGRNAHLRHTVIDNAWLGQLAWVGRVVSSDSGGDCNEIIRLIVGEGTSTSQSLVQHDTWVMTQTQQCQQQSRQQEGISVSSC